MGLPRLGIAGDEPQMNDVSTGPDGKNSRALFVVAAWMLLVAVAGGAIACTGAEDPPRKRDSAVPPDPQPDAAAPPKLDGPAAPADQAPPSDSPAPGPDAGAGGTGGRDGGGGGGAGGSDGGGTGGDGAAGANLFDNPLAPLPMDLKDVGLFPAFPDQSRVNARAYLFAPRYALWSNGLDKVRYIVLPQGQKINTANREQWDFPVGTLFFKTFSFPDPAMGGKMRPVETRLIRRVLPTGPRKEQWEFSVYEWSEDGRSATLLNIRNPKDRQVTIGGQMITHEIPSRLACQECHIANFTAVIGFDELRLNAALAGQTKTQLQDVIDKQWLTVPPAAPHAQIVDTDPARKWIREYMHGNCGHCHNGGMTTESITRVYDLRHNAFVMNTVNKMTDGRTLPGTRIIPGNPDESRLWQALARQQVAELKEMPPIGVQAADMEAVEKLRQWIVSLRP